MSEIKNLKFSKQYIRQEQEIENCDLDNEFKEGKIDEDEIIAISG